MLAEQVAAGKLPPLEHRLPSDPLVVKPYEKPGTYGGTWHLMHDNPDLGIKGILNGNHVVWNAQDGYPAKSRGMVFDLHLSWKARPQDDLSPELFTSWRNIFSNEQLSA